MMAEIRLAGKLYEAIRGDIARPHPFADERIGFAFAKMGNRAGKEPLIILHRYVSIPDERYVEDPDVGARIDGDAITGIMQQVLDHRPEREGAFHVHVHDHEGRTGPSRTDRDEIPLLIPSFRRVGKETAHGFIIFSKDHGLGWVWLPGEKEPVTASRIVVVGSPLSIFESINK